MQSKRHMKYAKFGRKNNSVQEDTSVNRDLSPQPYQQSRRQIQDQSYWQESAGHPKKSLHQHHAASVLDMQRYKMKQEDSSRSPYKSFSYDTKNQTIGGIEQLKFYDVSFKLLFLNSFTETKQSGISAIRDLQLIHLKHVCCRARK